METPSRWRLPAALALDALLAFAGLFGVYRLTRTASLPAALQAESGGLRVIGEPLPAAASGLRPGDILETMDGCAARSSAAADFLLDGRRPGESVRLDVRRGDVRLRLDARLVPRNGAFFPATVAIVASLLFFAGIGMLVRRPGQAAAWAGHGLTAAMATALLTIPGWHGLRPAYLGQGLTVLHILALAAVPVLFFRLTLLYPRRPRPPAAAWTAIPLLLAFGLAGWRIAAFRHALADPAGIDAYLAATAANRAFFVAGILAGVLALIQAYRTLPEEAARRRTRWVTLGLGAGLAAVALLWQVPALLGGPLPGGGGFVLALAGLLLAAVAGAVLRFRHWDIDPAWNRQAVFTAMLLALLAVYGGVLALAAAVTGPFPLPVAVAAAGGAAAVAALAFGPFRDGIERLIDARFSTRRYRLQEAVRSGLDRLQRCWDPHEVALTLAAAIAAEVPAAWVAVLDGAAAPAPGRILARHGDVPPSIEPAGLGAPPPARTPAAAAGEIEPDVAHVPLSEDLRSRHGTALLLAVPSGEGRPLGMLALGPKSTGVPYTADETALLQELAAHAGLALERIALQQSLVRQQLEAERQSELSRAKSFFVASVSHELRTPLTAIRMHAELLRTRPGARKAREYLEVIEGEAMRLTRLIENVLDAARIERGEKQYRPMPLDLNGAVRDALRALRYPLRRQGARVRLRLARPAPVVQADRDAVIQALTNLVDNALKYSADDKTLLIETRRTAGVAAIAVADRGVGIAPEERARVFEPFFRSADPAIRTRAGAGLGLALVRHIMAAHNGRVEVNSRPGRGSRFTLFFPKEEVHGPDPDR